MCRTINQIPWPEIMIKNASAWGQRSKELIANNSIQFLNRHGGKLYWDNDDLSELEVTTELPKMINPDMVSNLPGIELESDFPQPAVPESGEKPDIITQFSATRLNSGLDDETEANIKPRVVIETPDMSLRDDVDPGFSRGQGLFPKIEE